MALHDCGRTAIQKNLEIVKRLADENDAMADYVRSLRIGPFRNWWTFDADQSSLLEAIMQNINNLQVLTWNTHRRVPSNLLKIFHEKHPSARLNIGYYDRMDMPLDYNLLASPQLHSLSTILYVENYLGDIKSGELQVLKKALIQGSNLKSLTLFCNSPLSQRKLSNSHAPHNTSSHSQATTNEPIHFNWQENDSFPGLEKLTMCRAYEFTSNNCQMWAKFMDWSKLTELDLYEAAPSELFLALTDRIPNLKRLKFAIKPRISYDLGSLPLEGSLYPMEIGLPRVYDFLVSATALEYLYLEIEDFYDFEEESEIAEMDLMEGPIAREYDVSTKDIEGADELLWDQLKTSLWYFRAGVAKSRSDRVVGIWACGTLGYSVYDAKGVYAEYKCYA